MNACSCVKVYVHYANRGGVTLQMACEAEIALQFWAATFSVRATTNLLGQAVKYRHLPTGQVGEKVNFEP